MITHYTREAGVRDLQRTIAAVARASQRESRARRKGPRHARGARGNPRARALHTRSRRTPGSARRGDWFSLDAGGRRDSLRRSELHAGVGEADPDGAVGRRDERVRANRAEFREIEAFAAHWIDDKQRSSYSRSRQERFRRTARRQASRY